MDGIDHLWRAGPIALPGSGSGRVVWGTGKVAIGLRYQAPDAAATGRESTRWLAA